MIISETYSKFNTLAIKELVVKLAWEKQIEMSEVPGGAADGYVFSWEGVATKAAITRRLSRSYHHLDPEVVPRRSSEASSLSVVSTLPFG